MKLQCCHWWRALFQTTHTDMLHDTLVIQKMLQKLETFIKCVILLEASSLPPTSAVEVIEWDLCVCLCVCEHSHGQTVWPMYLCLCLNPSQQRDFWPKGLYNGWTREVHERSGIFIYKGIKPTELTTLLYCQTFLRVYNSAQININIERWNHLNLNVWFKHILHIHIVKSLC